MFSITITVNDPDDTIRMSMPVYDGTIDGAHILPVGIYPATRTIVTDHMDDIVEDGTLVVRHTGDEWPTMGTGTGAFFMADDECGFDMCGEKSPHGHPIAAWFGYDNM